jgi:hypothetical protein
MAKAKAKGPVKAKAPAKKSRYVAKTVATAASVPEFIARIGDPARREDAKALAKLFGEVSGWKAKMWGAAIIGFGAYHYTYASGHSGSICAVGFSPRKANFALYVADFPGKEALLKRLGKHKGGLKQCLYVDRLADVDLGVLKQIVAGALEETKKRWPVTAS